MIRGEYVKDMRTIGKLSLDYLDNYIKKKIEDKALFDIVTLFLKKRKDTIARPWIVKNSWSYFSPEAIKNIERCIPLASAAELENISNYQSNAVYDNKYVISQEEDKIYQTLASFITRDLVDDILFEEYETGLASLLSNILRKIDFYDQCGQYEEFSKLYYKPNFDNENLIVYTQNYLKKAMYYGGAWMGGLILAGAMLTLKEFPKKNQDLEHLINFGILSGTAINIITDISDYALFENKKNEFGMHYKNPEDQFKDIENKRILLPFYFALHCAQKENKEDYTNLKNFIGIPLSLRDKKEVLNLIKKYDGLSYAYSVARLINNEAKRRIINRVKSPERVEIKLFKILSSIVENNKFLHYYRSRDAIKKIKVAPEIEQIIETNFLNEKGIAHNMKLNFLESMYKR